MQSSSFFKHLILLFFILLTINSQTSTSISCILLCTEHSKTYIITSSPQNKSYEITIQVLNESYLPLVFTVHGSTQSIPQFEFNSKSAYSNIDMESVMLDQKIQKLRVKVRNGQEARVFIKRLDLGTMGLGRNLDRVVQDYRGDNLQQLMTCTKNISFMLNITQIDQQPSTGEVIASPFSQQDCVNSEYIKSTGKCICSQDYGMPTCSAYIQRISQLNQTHYLKMNPKSKSFYYFEPTDQILQDKQTLNIQINIKGSSTSTYFTYNQLQQNPQFTILWNIQQATDKKQIVSYFNQLNPASISGISLRKGERLVFTVYKPVWAVAEMVEVSVSLQYSFLSQFIIILIVVCSCVTVVSVVGFVGYLVYNKNKRSRDSLLLSMGAAIPVPGSNKTFNNYIDTDKHFPTITYKQLKSVTKASESSQDNEKLACPICLEVFEDDSLIKSTFCLHIFHENCLYQWMLRQPSCPLCRREYLEQELDKMEIEIGIYQLNFNALDRYYKIWKFYQTRQTVAENVKPVPLNIVQMESSHNIRPANQQQP